MIKACRSIFCFVSIFLLLGLSSHGQERKGTISGHATDVNHDSLVGARVEVQPNGYAVTTDAQGAFTISDLVPGKYTLTVSYVGFKPFSREVTIASGGVENVDPVLDRKSTRLNSSHGYISYAVFCLKKKKKTPLQFCI